MSNGLICPVDMTLPGVITPGQSGTESNDNDGQFRILQSYNITGTSPSDCLMSYTGHLLGVFYPSADTQSVYSTV